MHLTPCFAFSWQVDPAAATVIPPEGREGVHLSDGEGEATGELSGRMRFSMYSGDCPLDPGYLQLPPEQPKAVGDHVCTVNPGAVLETHDGALIQFDLRGFGLRLERRAPVWSVNGSLRMFTVDDRYRAFTDHLYVFEGEFDESVGRATYQVLRQQM